MRVDNWLLLCLLVYAPHMLEEHFAGMAFALDGVTAWSMFQIMVAVSLGMAWLVSRGGRSRDAVLSVLALALLGEAHHLVRAAVSFSYNPGLATALPMPIAGALLWRAERD